jgi:hypothetical protein
MSKSHVSELQQLYTAIMKDAVYRYPTLGDDFEKDLARLLRLSNERGIHLFVVDLPRVGKHLDRCLSNGEYILSGLPLTKRVSKRVVIPKLFRGLYLLIFEKSGLLREDCDLEAVFFLRQLLYTAKKAALSCDDEKVQKEISAFFAVDDCLPDVDNVWAAVSVSDREMEEAHPSFSDSPLYLSRLAALDESERKRLSVFLRTLDKVSNILTSTLGPYQFQDWRFRHGPGAVSETTGPVNKYDWLTWSDRLETAFPIADCGFHNYASWADNIEKSGCASLEAPSRLIDVPKTFSGPRLIAAEPASSQFCQQNIWHYFHTRTYSSWIQRFVQFSDQTLNQELCTRGSGDGSLATVDLSSASDRVTCHVVGLAFRGNLPLVLALRASRTRHIKQVRAKHLPAILELKKFSTMGSACTFPVESLVFLMITIAAVLSERRLPVTAGAIKKLEKEVAVFGDDIIIPVDSRELLFDALEILDFKVNANKSYWNGLFRESCGVDSFKGVNVTPAYWKAPTSDDPESVASTLSVSNNFHGRLLLNTSNLLASTIPGKYPFPLVKIGSGVTGRETFVDPGLPRCKSRWNKDLHRIEFLVPVHTAHVKKTPISNDSALLQYFTEDPSPYLPWKGGVAQRPKSRIRFRWVPDHAF